MKTISVPWGAWHEEGNIELSCPDHWDIEMSEINESAPISSEQIMEAVRNPIGCKRISLPESEDKTVAIAVEDITRPSYLGDILSSVIDDLDACGVSRENIRFIICNGAHRPLQREDLLKKLGQHIVDNYLISNHNPYDNLVDTGIVMGKTPVMINRFFMEADIRIIVGSILPHAFAGFSGGAKLVIPGLSGIDVLARSHKFVLMGFRGGIGIVDDNKFRTEIESIVAEIGIDFFVGYVPNAKRQISGVFAGEMVAAHRAGVEYARSVFETEIPEKIDIAILNAYPKDMEFMQVETVFSAVKSAVNNLNDDGVIIITSACSEGFGCHSLFSPGMKLYRPPSRKSFLSGRDLFFFSPNINRTEFHEDFWEGYSFFNKWEELIDSLDKKYPNSSRVVVFPTAPLQLARKQ